MKKLPYIITDHPTIRALRGQFHRAVRPMREITLRKELMAWASKHDCDARELIAYVTANPLTGGVKRNPAPIESQVEALRADFDALRADHDALLARFEGMVWAGSQ
jgi:hypothetical protein